MRAPDLVLAREDGTVYLNRWHVIRRNRWLNIYLHQFLGSDYDGALHDHPWAFLSIILKGGYWEHRANGPLTTRSWRSAGSVAYRAAKAAHRVELERDWVMTDSGPCEDRNAPEFGEYCEVWNQLDKPAWTLFFTGPKIRSWGFHCPQGWTHWYRFRGYTGANGCGEL